jgi:hypothetical protein
LSNFFVVLKFSSIERPRVNQDHNHVIKSRKFVLAIMLVAAIRSSALPKAVLTRQQVVEALAGAKEATLYSLNPSSFSDQDPDFAKLPTYAHHVVKKKMSLNEKQTKTAIRSIWPSLSAWKPSIGHCFEPRHGLHVVAEGKTYDVLICYECGTLIAWTDAGETPPLALDENPDVLDDLLKDIAPVK